MRPGRDADTSPPSSADVKNRAKLYLFTIPKGLRGLWQGETYLLLNPLLLWYANRKKTFKLSMAMFILLLNISGKIISGVEKSSLRSQYRDAASTLNNKHLHTSRGNAFRL